MKKILDFIYSMFFNLKVFPFKLAVKMPIIISHKTKIKNKLRKGSIIINGPVNSFMISLGIEEGTFGINIPKYNYLLVGENASITFHGRTVISQGFAIRVFNNGKLYFGQNNEFNSSLTVACCKSIKLGNKIKGGWCIELRDSDGHPIYNLDDLHNQINNDKEIIIGDDVWMSANTAVLKGSVIPDGTVTAFRSCVTRKFEQKNTIIGGCPAKIIKENICWRM